MSHLPPYKMSSLKLLLHGIAALFVLLTFTDATNLTVSATGGNASSPLLYGLMFEVRCHLAYYLPLLIALGYQQLRSVSHTFNPSSKN
jgi:hypothetical protein